MAGIRTLVEARNSQGLERPRINLRFIPMRRFGRAEDLTALAVLLASDAAGFMSGQVYHVDGGVSTHL